MGILFYCKSHSETQDVNLDCTCTLTETHKHIHALTNMNTNHHANRHKHKHNIRSSRKQKQWNVKYHHWDGHQPFKLSYLMCSGSWHMNNIQLRDVSGSCGGVRYLRGQICLQLWLLHAGDSPHLYFGLWIWGEYDRSGTRKEIKINVCVYVWKLTLLYHSVGDDPVLQSQCVSLYPPEVGSSLGFCRHVWHRHPEAVQVQ